MSTETRPAWWPTEVEDPTILSPGELHERIEKTQNHLSDRAISVCWALQVGSDPAERLEQFSEAETALAVLYAENRRRIDLRKAAGTWPFAD